jgi:hypothetical protein
VSTPGGGIFISKNYGVSWEEVWGWRWDVDLGAFVEPLNLNSWSGVASSADGSKIIVFSSGLYYFTNTPFSLIVRQTNGVYATAFGSARLFTGSPPSAAYNQYYMSSDGLKFIYLDNTTGTPIATLRLLYWNINTWTASGYNIDLVNAGFGAYVSLRYRLSGDGSLIAVYAYLASGFGTYDLITVSFTWEEPNSSPGQNSTVTIADVGSSVQTTAGIPSGMTADGGVQMVAAWNGSSPSGTLKKYISYNSGISWSEVTEIENKKVYAIFFSPTGSYTTIFTENISSKAIIQAFTATTTGTRIVTPFVSQSGNDWPTYYKPSGPGTVEDALDLIARFLNANMNEQWSFFS